MAAIRALEAISAKWATVSPQRTADYESGVRAPRQDWARATGAANDAWKQGIQAAVTADRFAKGVQRAGTAKWSAGVLLKGLQRWGPGVQIGQDAYARGFARYREAIAAVQLPPRFGRRDPRNLQRVNAIVDALVKAKAAAS